MPKTLLVVDESKTIREAARLALAGDGWTVAEAASTPEAFRELVDGPPDAVLCDAGLAGEDYDFCREIRGIPEARDIPIVLMGASVDSRAATAAGAGATVPKPFSSDELAAALRAVVELRAMSSDADDTATFGDDEPLTLEELSGPFRPGGSPPAPASETTVEIIDLSGEDDFEDLELLEDLEPVAVSPATPPREEGWDAAGWGARLASEPISPSTEGPSDPFGLSDLSDEELSGIDLLDSDTEHKERATLGTDARGPTTELELPDDLGFGLSAPPPIPVQEGAPTPPAVSPDREGFLETPDSYLPPRAVPETDVWGFDSTPLEAHFSEERPAPTEPAAGVEASAREAVREALANNLTGDKLAPGIERVVERVVWEVVPQLAERLIREAIEKLKSAPPE